MFRCLSLPVILLGFAGSAAAAEADKYLLDDTDAVLGVNVKLLMGSPLVKKNYLPLARKQLQDNAELRKQLGEVGLDPFRDVDRVLLVHGDSCHRTVDGKEQVGPLVIIRGRFNPAKVHAKAAQLGQLLPNLVKIHKTANGVLYEVTQPQPFFFAFPDRTALVGGQFKDQVADALAKGRNRKERKLVHFGMQFLIEQADNKHAIWVAALGRTALGDKTPLPTAKGKKVQPKARKKLSDSGIEELSGGFAVSDGVQAKFRVKVPDPETAKTLSELAQQILPQLAGDDKLEDKKFDPVRAFLGALVVGADDNYLILQSQVPGKVFVESLK